MALVLVTSVALPVLGIVVVGAIAVGIIKIFWSAGESVVESALSKSDAADLDNNFIKWKNKSFSEFDIYARQLFKVPDDYDVSGLLISTTDISNALREKIEQLIWIEIYDNRILIGRKIGDVKNLLNLQLDRYDKWGKK